MGKEEQYQELVTQRKACDCCQSDLVNASRIKGGRWDSSRIGPYSQWQGNLDAELMIVAQDFADIEGFCEHEGWPGQRVETNLRLVRFLAHAGTSIEPPRYGTSDDRLFFTNAVLCMKSDGMRGPVPARCVRKCGRFLCRLVEIIRPKVVVSLGLPAARALCQAFDKRSPLSLRDTAATAIALNADTTLMPLYHPTASRTTELQHADWRKVRDEQDRSA